eukprot:10722296-Ditylum_brightwellii.AAC.1
MAGDYTMTAICTFALPVLRFITPMVTSTNCTYIRARGGGLTGAKDTQNCECAALAKYVLNITDPLTQMGQNTPTPMQKFLLKFTLSP